MKSKPLLNLFAQMKCSSQDIDIALFPILPIRTLKIHHLRQNIM